MVGRWVMDKDDKVRDEKYKNLAAWILEWETMKEAKQQESRNLAEKERTVGLTVDEKILKEKVDRQAKVTTGAETLFSVLEKIMEQGARVDKILLESVYNKLQFNVKTRVCVDFSGSMRGLGGRPIRTAAIAATAATMLQNDNQYDLIMGFSRSYRIWSSMIEAEVATNHFMRGSTEKVKLIDRKDSFYDNYLRVLRAYQNGEAAHTDPCQIALAFKDWVDKSPNAEERSARIEEIQSCPVMLIISDGDFNCSNTPGSSMAKLQSDLKHWFNYEPIFVIWNIPYSGSDSSKKFEYQGNIIHVTTWNISTINNIFTKLSSMDIVDQFIELKTLSENNRYDLVKAAVI